MITASRAPSLFARLLGRQPLSRIAMLFFVAAGSLAYLLDRNTLIHVIPVLLLLQFLAVSYGVHRFRERDSFIWRSGQIGFFFEALTFLAFMRTTDHSNIGFWTTANAALGSITLICFAVATAKAFRPLFHLPATAVGAKLALIGSGLALASTQWLQAGQVPTGAVGIGVRAILLASAGLLLVTRVLLDAPLKRLHRSTDLLLLTTNCVFGVGQAIAFAAYGSHPPASAYSYMLIATGIMAAASLDPAMQKLGHALSELSDRPLTIVAPIVLLAVFLVDAVVTSQFHLLSSAPTLVVITAAVVALQLVGLVWLFGALLSTPGAMRTLRDVRLRRDLRKALIRGEIEAHYQPIYRVGDLAVAGYETLARWPHRRLGLLEAHQFLPIAEREGFLAAIDRLMIQQAAEALPLLFTTSTVDEPFVTVNIESRRLQEAGFAEEVLADLERRHLNPNGLLLEVVEVPDISDWTLLRHNAGVFQDAGIGIAIDDFGAGQANLGFLVRIDPDMVKLDSSLVRAAVSSRRGRDVARLAIEAARSSGARIVVKGIAEDAWIQPLRELDVDLMQGFALGMILPAPSSLAETSAPSP